MNTYRTTGFLMLALLAVVLSGCKLNADLGALGGGSRPLTVSGTVSVPAEMLAGVDTLSVGAPGSGTAVAAVHPESDLVPRVLGLFARDSVADVHTGSAGGDVGSDGSFVPISGVQVELVRLTWDPATGTYSETPLTCDGGCPVTASDGTFTVTTTESPSSTLALKVTFTDPVDGTSNVVMRAMVVSSEVDITPTSEAATQIIVDSLNDFVDFGNFTVSEVNALVHLVEDEEIDISGLNFTSAIDKIKTEASDILSRFVIGFKEPGEVAVANINDIFNIMEVRSRLTSPNATFLDGAAEYRATLSGAASFDDFGRFQSNARAYYWGLRSAFLGSPVRVFDEPIVEEEQDPSNPNYLNYLDFGEPVGFSGIVGAENGMAVAPSDTESTTYGFISNNGQLMAFLSERNDESNLVYERGLRVLMKKWTEFTEDSFADITDFDNDTIDYADKINDSNNSLNTGTSSDLNPLMDQNTYNVLMYEHRIDDGGIQVGTSTGTWFFDAGSSAIVNDGNFPSGKPHGAVTPVGLDRDVMNYIYSIGAVARTQAAAMEPCPNLFLVSDGGTLMLRRDTGNSSCNGEGFNLFSGQGAVASDGEIFIVPQVFDDSEDDVTLEYTLPSGLDGRRGWYMGLRQQTGMTDENIKGIYHVVGMITHLDGSTDTITNETKYGSLQFHPTLNDGFGNRQVTGTLHSKQSYLDDIDTGDGIAPTLTRTKSLKEEVTGSYLASSDGTFSFTLPGTTDTVTGIAGQLITLQDGTELAMYLAIPVNTNGNNRGSRGIMLLAHEFVVDYPLPPRPPGPPPPPSSTPPSSPS